MTLRIPAKVLLHVCSYDFYDMTLSTGKQRRHMIKCCKWNRKISKAINYFPAVWYILIFCERYVKLHKNVNITEKNKVELQ